jgi:hypothetical protein
MRPEIQHRIQELIDFCNDDKDELCVKASLLSLKAATHQPYPRLLAFMNYVTDWSADFIRSMERSRNARNN